MKYKKTHDPKLRNQIMDSYTSLVEKIAYHLHKKIYLKRIVDLEDLIQLGNLGLMDAIESYNSNNGGMSFEEYAKKKIGWKIIDELRRLKLIQYRSRKNPPSLLNFSEINFYGNSHGRCFIENIFEDKNYISPEDKIEKKDTMEFLTEGLNRTEKLILKLYFFQGFTFQETGKVVGLTEARISQCCQQVLSKIRIRLKNRNVSYYDFV